MKGAQFGEKNTKFDHQETYIFMQEHGQSPAIWPQTITLTLCFLIHQI